MKQNWLVNFDLELVLFARAPIQTCEEIRFLAIKISYFGGWIPKVYQFRERKICREREGNKMLSPGCDGGGVMEVEGDQWILEKRNELLGVCTGKGKSNSSE